MYKHGAKVEPQMKATVRCSARPIIGLKETDSLSMDKVLEKLGKYPCLEWAIALMPVLLGGLVYLLYRPKNIILFEVLNKLGGELTKLVQLRDAGVLTEKEFQEQKAKLLQ